MILPPGYRVAPPLPRVDALFRLCTHHAAGYVPLFVLIRSSQVEEGWRGGGGGEVILSVGVGSGGENQ